MRPKGSPNKRSLELLKKLERDHNFHIVPKIVKLYEENEELYQPLLEKIRENIRKGLPMDARFDEAEVEIFNSVRKDTWVILSTLLAYCYPKLKALEVQAETADKITFNINVPKGQHGDYAMDLDKVSVKMTEEEEEDNTIH